MKSPPLTAILTPSKIKASKEFSISKRASVDVLVKVSWEQGESTGFKFVPIDDLPQ